MLNYYAAVADLILPYLKDRPLSLKRYPNGIKEQFFFQKDTPDTYPDWLRTERIDDINYVFAGDHASLLYLVNLGCIDHNPWMSRSGSLDHPDFILIDLDPQECPYDLIVEAALLVKRVLEQIGLVGYPKTTGGDGMHVYIPIEPVYSYEEARTFAELIARLVTHEKPHLFTTPRSVAKRQKNRVYFDYLQIGKSKTIAAPYVLRAYEGAPVATPLEWAEVVTGPEPEAVPHSQLPRAIPRRRATCSAACWTARRICTKPWAGWKSCSSNAVRRSTSPSSEKRPPHCRERRAPRQLSAGHRALWDARETTRP